MSLLITPLVPAIGGPVTGGTTGSFLFIGAGPVLAQDNSNIFYDFTNKRVGIGTATPAGKLEIETDAAGEIGLSIMGAASQTAAVSQIVDSGGTVLSAFYSDLSVTNSYHHKFFPGGFTIGSSDIVYLQSSINTLEFSAGSGFTFTLCNSIMNINGLLAGFGTGVVFFNFSSVLNFKNGSIGTLGLPIFFNSIDVFADGITGLSWSAAFASFNDLPTFGVKNSGTFDAAAYYMGYLSGFTCSGGTIDERVGYRVADRTGAGTVNTQVGLDIDTLVNATTNIAIRTGASGNIEFGNKITTYNSIVTVSNGVPSELAQINLVTQAAAIAANTIYTPTATGMFRLSIYAQVTRAATTSSTLGGAGGMVLTYNDGNGNVAQTKTVAFNTVAGAIAINSAGNLTTTNLEAVVTLYARTGVAIQYAFGYTSSGATTMQFSLNIRLEAM